MKQARLTQHFHRVTLSGLLEWEFEDFKVVQVPLMYVQWLSSWGQYGSAGIIEMKPLV